MQFHLKPSLSTNQIPGPHSSLHPQRNEETRQLCLEESSFHSQQNRQQAYKRQDEGLGLVKLVIPSLQYQLAVNHTYNSCLVHLENQTTKMVWKWLNLPRNSTHVLLAHPASLNIPSISLTSKAQPSLLPHKHLRSCHQGDLLVN